MTTCAKKKQKKTIRNCARNKLIYHKTEESEIIFQNLVTFKIAENCAVQENFYLCTISKYCLFSAFQTAILCKYEITNSV